MTAEQIISLIIAFAAVAICIYKEGYEKGVNDTEDRWSEAVERAKGRS